jgi:hypothetical protein
MDLNLNMTPQSREVRDVYAIAFECARNQESKWCKRQCATCQYNAYRYGHAQVEVARIIVRAQYASIFA